MMCSGEVGLSLVVLLLDDMRFDQLDVLTTTNARLAEHAVVFDRAYVTIPMCCPERASFLSGGFLPQHTGVLTNEAPRGGATMFDDADTLATRLQSEGYATAMFGKYLNEYSALGPYVPPGWTQYVAVDEGGPYDEYTATSGSSTPEAPGIGVDTDETAYVTYWQGTLSEAFVGAHPADPLFLYVSFRAPHEPHEPASEDKGAFAGFSYRGGAFNEPDVSDKPGWVQETPQLTEAEIAGLDQSNAGRLETLLSVDRVIASLVDRLEAEGRLDQTVIVITSDNGQQWGEHRLLNKGVAYEDSVHVPLVVWGADLAPRHSDALVATNLDIAASATDFAGLPARGDGQSLRDVACGETDAHREFVPLQGWPSREPAWSALVTAEWKYIETGATETELYDLLNDPIEAENVAEAQPAVVAELGGQLAGVRGLAITETVLPDAEVGAPYSHAVGAWGGSGTYRWSRKNGALPDGLSFSEAGLLAGNPTKVGTASLTLHVEDDSVSPYDGRPQFDERHITVNIVARAEDSSPTAEPDCGCDEGAGAGMAVAWAAAWRRRRRSA